MSQFEKTLEKLNNNPAAGIKVINKDTGLTLAQNRTGYELKTEYGSVENFFDELAKRGHKRIEITDRLRNGSVYKKNGDPYTVNISGTPEENPTQQQMSLFEKPMTKPAEAYTPAPTVVPASAHNPVSYLQGTMGLNMAVYQQMDHPRLQTENARLTAENEKLKKDNWELEKKLIVIEATEGQSVAKSKANADMLGQLAPLLAPVLEKVMSGGANTVPGLGGANLSATKQQVVQIISGTDDELAVYLGVIARNEANDALMNDLVELVNKYNLIPQENA